ncbi:MAG: hypothetical protein E6767_03840 [Dysgonomonas sp.]|nr:hypothetical protein [Dysgonomonas sp.]
MVDCKALKIGNYILDEKGEFCTVKSLNCQNGTCTINGTSPELYNPIKLTEDIVLKCGFFFSGKDDSAKHFRHHNTSLGITFGDEKFYFIYCDKIGDLILEDKISIRIDNLHRLQNLFYCLSAGKQLEVKI